MFKAFSRECFKTDLKWQRDIFIAQFLFMLHLQYMISSNTSHYFKILAALSLASLRLSVNKIVQSISHALQTGSEEPALHSGLDAEKKQVCFEPALIIENNNVFCFKSQPIWFHKLIHCVMCNCIFSSFTKACNTILFPFCWS